MSTASNSGPMYTIRCSTTLQQFQLAGPGAKVVLKCTGLPVEVCVTLSYGLELLLEVGDGPSFAAGGCHALTVNSKRVTAFPHQLRTADVLEITPAGAKPSMYLVSDAGGSVAQGGGGPTKAAALSSQVREASALFAPMQKLMRDICLKVVSLAAALGTKDLLNQRPPPSADLPEQLELTYSAEWCFDALDRLETRTSTRKKTCVAACQVPLDVDRHLVGAEFALAARNDAALCLLRSENMRLREMLTSAKPTSELGKAGNVQSSVPDLLLEIDALRSQLDRKNSAIQALVADVWHKDRQIDHLTYGLPQDVQQAIQALDFERRRYTELIRQHRLKSLPAQPLHALRKHNTADSGPQVFGYSSGGEAVRAATASQAVAPMMPPDDVRPIGDEERIVDAFVTMQLALRDALLSGQETPLC